MSDEGNNVFFDEERLYRLVDSIYRIVGQAEKRFDGLRDTDREAFRLVYAEVMKRLEGFPERYATKAELDQAAMALRQLENNSLSRVVYEERHNVLKEEVDALEKLTLPRSVFDAFMENYRLDQERSATERGKAMPRSVFETFVENYRIDQEKANADRHSVVETLAHATNQVRDQVIRERGEFVTQDMFLQRQQSTAQQIDAIERWQYKLIGGLVFATFVAPLVTGVVVYLITKGPP